MADETHRRSRSAPTNDQDATARETEVFSNPPEPDHDVRPTPRPSQLPDDSDAFRDSFKRKPKGSWHQNLTVDWKEKWTDDAWSNGRVMIVDYMRWDKAKKGKIKALGQEFKDIHGLRKLYDDTRRCKQAALRVIHVQNAPWAVRFLMHKYNIGPSDDLIGTDFGKWVKFTQPEWRAGRPLLKGKTWRTQRDPWRAIRRTGFGIDYLQAYDIRGDSEGSHLANSDIDRRAAGPGPDDKKMMELNCYDETDAPCYGWDVVVQRLGVWVQYSEGEPRTQPGVKNPYVEAEKAWKDDPEKEEWKHSEGTNGYVHRPKLPPFASLDNGNTIIIFENSPDNSVTNTLIGARQQIESRWRRLSLYLPEDDIADDSRLALECTDLILEDVLKAVVANWEHFFNVTESHIAILEDKIYDSPADESRAPELWYNSSAWLKVERLAYIHAETVKELLTHIDDLPDRPDLVRTWLDGITEQFDKITTLVQEDLVKPTNNLSDLMYKSVEIRDSRQSLGLSTSMWRLSWITFIFLPLTFIVGFCKFILLPDYNALTMVLFLGLQLLTVKYSWDECRHIPKRPLNQVVFHRRRTPHGPCPHPLVHT